MYKDSERVLRRRSAAGLVKQSLLVKRYALLLLRITVSLVILALILNLISGCAWTHEHEQETTTTRALYCIGACLTVKRERNSVDGNKTLAQDDSSRRGGNDTVQDTGSSADSNAGAAN